VADKIPVSFSGAGTGAAALTWGQQTIWRAMELGDSRAPILTGIALLSEGTTVAHLAGVLEYLMSRHQSLRTQMRLADDGRVLQVLASSGEHFLEVIDAPDDAEPRTFARALADEFEAWEHDCFTEWPIRMAVVRQRGIPVYRVLGICHLTSDGFGVVTLLNDLGEWDLATGQVLGPANLSPVTAMEPLEQACWQASAAGERSSAISERHWAKLLRTIPARRFPVPAEKKSPRSGRAVYDSQAIFLASQVIAARIRTDTSPVLLAAAAVAIARVSGINPAVPRMFVSNRFRGRLADTVSPIAQTCPCLIDVAGVTFDEAVRRTMSATIAALKHAYFNPVRIRAVIAAASEERGEPLDLACVYNDRRLVSPREADTALPAPADLRAALRRSTLRWENRSDRQGEPCLIHIRDSLDSVNIMLSHDSHYICATDVEALLRAIEEVIVAAALDPDMHTGI
jgi:hypothetical protein